MLVDTWVSRIVARPGAAGARRPDRAAARSAAPGPRPEELQQEGTPAAPRLRRTGPARRRRRPGERGQVTMGPSCVGFVPGPRGEAALAARRRRGVPTAGCAARRRQHLARGLPGRRALPPGRGLERAGGRPGRRRACRPSCAGRCAARRRRGAGRGGRGDVGGAARHRAPPAQRGGQAADGQRARSGSCSTSSARSSPSRRRPGDGGRRLVIEVTQRYPPCDRRH